MAHAARSFTLIFRLLTLVSCRNFGDVHCEREEATVPPQKLVQLTPNVTIPGEVFGSAQDGNLRGHSYYGIRYGSAKRFEHSTENTDFTYLAALATRRSKAGPICLQHTGTGMISSTDHGPMVMDEDCLYLDVHVPFITENSRQLLPVLMYIHGGALQAGDKDIFNGASLAAEMNAIIVVINYRLSIFGWLSTGDAVLPGNYGLGDCKLALHWVVKHIDKFGGDAHRLTVAGHSAGSMLVSALYMDPDCRQMMQAAISLSGSAFLERMFVRDPKSQVVGLGRKVGCPNGSLETIVQCLKRAPAAQLLDKAKRVVKGDPDLVPYGFVIDTLHFPQHPRQLITEQTPHSSRATLITGFTQEDFALLVAITDPHYLDARQPLLWSSVQQNVAQWYLPLREPCAEPNLQLAERVMRYYNFSQTDQRSDMLLKYFHLTTDVMFGYPAAKEALLYAAKGLPVQVYIISYDQKFNGLGAFHAMELGYIFGPAVNEKMFNLTLHASVQVSILQMLRQIIHNGKMDGPLVGDSGRYSELGASGTWREGSADLKKMVAFWDAVAATPCRQHTGNETHKEL